MNAGPSDQCVFVDRRRLAGGGRHFRAGVRRCILPVIALLAIVGACRDSVEEASSKPRDVSPIPQPMVEAVEAGGRIATLDIEGLKAWCRDQDLPPPPSVTTCEPGVAEALTKYLRQSAADRSAGSFGAVGQVCYVIQDYDAARAYLEKAAELNPRDSRWPYYLGAVAQETRQEASAIEHLDRALELRPELSIAHARLAQLHVDRGELDAAWKHAEMYARMMTGDSLGYVLMGRVLLARGDADAAARQFEAAISRVSNDFQAHHYLGRAYAKLGRTDEARRQLEMATTMPKGEWFKTRDPLYMTAVDVAGSSIALVRELERILNTQRWNDMAKLMEQIIALRAGDFKMMANLADVYRKMGRFEDAHRLLDQAQRVSPGLAELQSKRAALYLSQDQYEDAVRSADLALAGSGADVQPWAVKGRALYLLGRFADAEPALRRVVELSPEEAQSWHLLGVVLHKLGRLDEASACYRRVQELVGQPEHPLYQAASDNLAIIVKASEN